jgi:outer membrane protein assembly factor BamB
MKNILASVSLCFGLLLASNARAAGPEADAKAIVAQSGIKGGLIVHIGAGDGQLTAALRVNGSFQVQGLESDPQRVAAAREFIRGKKLYGEVSVDRLEDKQLPYIDGLINLVVAEDLAAVPMAEVLRVLAPNGVAMGKKGGQWTKTVKPKPSGLDDWTHYYYDARGNTVSKDTVIAPPERLQWVGSPRWSRHHDRMSSLSAQVSCNGRMFYIMDEGSRISILLPSKWALIARDAFNGTILWKKPIAKWNTNLWPLKSGPTQLTRRLVAAGDRIYVTLGISAPVSCLDGATGEPVRVYAETKGAEEILHVNGTLYVLANLGKWELAEFAPVHNTGDQKRVETEFNWDEKGRDLMAVDAASGRVLWRNAAKVAPLTLAADGKRLVYHDGKKLICLDPATGRQRWASAPVTKRKLFEFNYGPRLLLHEDTVLYAGGDGSMKGVDAGSGKELWNAPHEKSGYRSPEDLIVAGGLVWNAGTTSGNQTGEFKGRDPRTGEVKKQFAPDVECYWFHHRCYIAKATEKYLLPSRTGIEFVDIAKSHWNINHWVRASCLYGVLPANGLVYAGPHNCACYPEAKLDGMNALAPAGATSKPVVLPEAQRLEHGPAWGQPLTETDADAKDWPTYRHDAARSGYSDQPLLDDLGKAWDINLGGRLSAPTIAGGKVFVAQVDEHTLHALDAADGKKLWHFIAGARIDSPPTFWKGRVLFGGMDGWVYCLRANDGAMIWRYLAAPNLLRHTAFEQIESVWPVHGSVLIENGVLSCVAGRSVFLDGGLRFVRLDAATGRKLVEVVYDHKDPETGGNLQMRHKTLQMPVGLNDILSSDGRHIYLRSQKINAADGKRVDIGPVSGNAIEQGAAQKGEGGHLFAPTGFLDDEWFHRSYWVYGKSFAGGHNGYYQAGKYTPAGRILVHDDKNVYGFGREPKYLKWTTTMEHQLFAASKEPPDVVPNLAEGQPKGKAKGKGKQAASKGDKPAAPTPPAVKFNDSPKLDPSNKPLTVEAWVQPEAPNGVIVCHGAHANGFALTLQEGRPAFSVRVDKQEASAQAARPLDPGWHHLAGALTEDKKLRLYVDGQLAAETKAPGLIPKKTAQPLHLGTAGTSLVTDHGGGAHYAGLLDQFAVFPKALSEAEIIQHATQANAVATGNGAMVACSFDKGDARDESGNGAQAVLVGVESGKGKVGAALWFKKPAGAVAAAGKGGGKPGAKRDTFVEFKWTQFMPIITRAMAMAGNNVAVSGPPDKVNEEYAFERLAAKDSAIQYDLAEQAAALEGKRGGTLQIISKNDGAMKGEITLDSPPVWDGMAVAQGRLFSSSLNGKVTCYGVSKK